MMNRIAYNAAVSNSEYGHPAAQKVTFWMPEFCDASHIYALSKMAVTVAMCSNSQISMYNAMPLTMEEYIAGISCEHLDVEKMLLEQRGAREVRLIAPFAGMDKSGRGVCIRNEQGVCTMGNVCPLRHIIGDKVCFDSFFLFISACNTTAFSELSVSFKFALACDSWGVLKVSSYYGDLLAHSVLPRQVFRFLHLCNAESAY
ncbi:unnamed protein product [Gongylonema pulchrum]|uniref:C3H1-type domain-containing protein n=1 Tax=Gongylonema pulchrum TaxID=637853 RepID=A0A183EI60_9BILA|nr:unnamed protein product [Gongylonema pulchrum]